MRGLTKYIKVPNVKNYVVIKQTSQIWKRVAITHHEHGPHSQCCPEPVFIQCPMHDKRRHGTEHAGPSPENAVGKTFPFHKPLVKIEDERIVNQGPSHAIKETLRKDKMDDMGGEGSGH